MHDARAEVIASFERATSDVDALVLPTAPIIPPPFSAFAHDPDYVRLNVLVLRNPSLANFLDGCAISLPIHREGEPPVGLMLIGRRGSDERLLSIAQSLEAALHQP